jgi:uncharacterized membrane protein YdbT with pleckstrin-like domain
MSPRPDQKHEYALTTMYPSWWRFVGSLVFAAVMVILGLYVLAARREFANGGWALVALGVFVVVRTLIARRSLSWSLTSERLIERRGLFSSNRREIELADIRSVEVDQRFIQRLLGLGNITVASAASADFLIRLEDISNPDAIAEQLRQARLKRLA